MNIELTKREALITVEALRFYRSIASPCGQLTKARKLSDLAKRITRKLEE